MRYLSITALSLLSILLLNACSTAPRQIPDTVTDNTGQLKNWAARQAALAKRSSWQLKARASVTYRGENWPFGIEWQQQSAQQYTMQVKHPLTQNTLATVVKASGAVTLTANRRVYRDSTAEKLIEKHLRVKLPVSGMQYWVRGIASPAYPVSSVELDRVGRPVQLQQAGWVMHYSNYESAGRDALPRNIKISRSSPQPVQVKMRIRQWQ